MEIRDFGSGRQSSEVCLECHGRNFLNAAILFHWYVSGERVNGQGACEVYWVIGGLGFNEAFRWLKPTKPTEVRRYSTIKTRQWNLLYMLKSFYLE